MRTRSYLGVATLVVLTVLIGLSYAHAASISSTIVVKKDGAPVPNATYAIYEVKEQFWGLWKSVGAYVASGTTDSNGTATVTLDDTKTYMIKVIADGKVYEKTFKPTSTVEILLEETTWIRGNIVPLLAGAGLVIIGIFLIAWIAPNRIRIR